jgi:hypothetical protein
MLIMPVCVINTATLLNEHTSYEVANEEFSRMIGDFKRVGPCPLMSSSKGRSRARRTLPQIKYEEPRPKDIRIFDVLSNLERRYDLHGAERVSIVSMLLDCCSVQASKRQGGSEVKSPRSPLSLNLGGSSEATGAGGLKRYYHPLEHLSEDFYVFQFNKLQRLLRDAGHAERILHEAIKLLRTLHGQLNLLPDSTRQQVMTWCRILTKETEQLGAAHPLPEIA